jgi:phosphoserine aminotransferase
MESLMLTEKPKARPSNSNFGSGPCSKRPGWTVEALKDVAHGRSHRSKIGKAKLKEVIDRSRSTLNIPDDYRIGIVPGSDTGAVEMVLWSVLGARPVDVLAWEAFGSEWAKDVVDQLKLENARIFEANYGELPDLNQVDFTHDVVFPWNGTTSGARIPNGDWIRDDREGLTICDATSAVYAMEIPWGKLDVVTYSWQKVLGGEAAHGMLILSPRAVERLENYQPTWPVPKVFRLTKQGALIEGIFQGSTINTPSLLCAEDALDALRWTESQGNAEGLRMRSEANLKAITDWVEESTWIEFLAQDPAIRSCTSVCLCVNDPDITVMSKENQSAFCKGLAGLLDEEGVAYDIASYRAAPPGLRLWGGATVETADLEKLFPWLDWAFHIMKSRLQA